MRAAQLILLKGRAQPTAPPGGGGGGGSSTTLNPSTTPAPGTTSGVTISAANLHAAGPSSSYGHACSLGAVASGKVRFEMKPTAFNTAKLSIGVCPSTKAIGPGGNSALFNGADTTGWYDNGDTYVVGSPSSNVPSLNMSVGTWVAIEIDVTGGVCYFMQGAYRSPSGVTLPAGTMYAFVGFDDASGGADLNFGPTWNIAPSDASFDHVLA